MLSKTFKSYVTRTDNVSKFILENRNDLIASCEEQAECFQGDGTMQQKYSLLVEKGYKFTLELNEKGKWVRKHSVANEWTAIKWIAENPETVKEADLEGRKIMGLRGLVKACKPQPTADSTLEGEGAEGEGDEMIEGQEEGATKRTFAELLKNFQDIGEQYVKIIDFGLC